MRRGLTLTLAAVTLLAGCGGSGLDVELRGASAATSPSVVSRSELAAALDERAWLTAFAASGARAQGVASANALAAQRALDAGSTALAAHIGDALGTRTEKRVIPMLRRQDELFNQLAVADKRRATAARTAILAALDATRNGLTGALATDDFARSTLRSDLSKATARLVDAVEAVAAGRPGAPSRTLLAAARAARPAGALALAADERRDPPTAGSASSPAADLGALAATTFTDAAYAQAATTAAGPKVGPPLRAARSTLETTTDALGQLVTSVYGEDAGGRFADIWTMRGVELANYAAAKRAGDEPAVRRALAALARFRTAVKELQNEVDPDGRPQGLAAALARDGAAATAAVRADLARSPKLGPRLLQMAQGTRAVGRAFVVRAARRFPSKFPAD